MGRPPPGLATAAACLVLALSGRTHGWATIVVLAALVVRPVVAWVARTPRTSRGARSGNLAA